MSWQTGSRQETKLCFYLRIILVKDSPRLITRNNFQRILAIGSNIINALSANVTLSTSHSHEMGGTAAVRLLCYLDL
jgi:hypothetical protein